MNRAGLITLEQARAAGLSFDEPEPRACVERHFLSSASPRII